MKHRIRKALTTAAENAIFRTPAGKLAKRVPFTHTQLFKVALRGLDLDSTAFRLKIWGKMGNRTGW